MSFIEWDKERFSVSVVEMDEQHIEWIALINTMHDSMVNKDIGITPKDATQKMIEYAKYHFKKEEQLMLNMEYPDIKNHSAAHNDFIRQLMLMEKDQNSGIYILKAQVMSVLKNWLENHITIVDKKYGEYAMAKGWQQN